MGFREIDIKDFKCKPFEIFDDKWMLLTAGNPESFNTMTCSWGGLGTLWDRTVTFSFVRPTRYTYEFMETGEYYTFSFFSDKYQDVLALCGAESGRDVDKVRATGITPAFADCGAVYFEEAELVIVCKKLYGQNLDNSLFGDKTIEKIYPKKDYHKVYVGEVLQVLER